MTIGVVMGSVQKKVTHAGVTRAVVFCINLPEQALQQLRLIVRNCQYLVWLVEDLKGSVFYLHNVGAHQVL